MRGTRLVTGATVVLVGAAATGLGGILGWAGGYGMVAAILLVPLGLGGVYFGMSLLPSGSLVRRFNTIDTRAHVVVPLSDGN